VNVAIDDVQATELDPDEVLSNIDAHFVRLCAQVPELTQLAERTRHPAEWPRGRSVGKTLTTVTHRRSVRHLVALNALVQDAKTLVGPDAAAVSADPLVRSPLALRVVSRHVSRLLAEADFRENSPR
jgi:hypothetical protein